MKQYLQWLRIGWAWPLALLTYAGVGVAQETTTGTETWLEEIVVTAQKRTQNFQELALSAAVVTPEALEAKGITQIQDALRTVPGVKVQNVAGTGSGRIFIRGLGTTSGDEFDAIVANGVAMNLDGVNSNNASNLLGTMFDVERIEVLKGPQGTLYGSSALGGVVNVITARPQHEFEASLRAQTGNYDQQSFQAMLNVPLGEQFAVRVTGTSDRRDGYVGAPEGIGDWYDLLTAAGFPGFLHDLFINDFNLDTDATFDNHGAIDTQGYRVKVLWEGIDDLSVLVSYDYQEFGGTAPTWLLPDDVMNGDLVCCRVYTAGPPPFATAGWYEDRYNYRESGTLSLELQYGLGDFADLTFLYGANEIRDKGQELTPTQLVENDFSTQEQATYELRLASPEDTALAWVIGYYYRDTDRNWVVNTSDLAPSPADGSYSFQRLGKPFDESNIFGQITYPLSDRLRVTAGGRFSETTDDFSYNLFKTDNPCSSDDGGTPFDPTDDVLCPETDTVAEIGQFGVEGDSITNFTWKLGFELDVASSRMIYGHVATGFKAGGLQVRNAQVPITQFAPISLSNYEPEESVSYEAGLKTRLLENRMQLSGAVFLTEWENMQLNTLVCVTAGCDPFVDPAYIAWYNAGPSTQYGLEFDTVWAVSARDRITASLTLMHGEYGETNYAWGAPGFMGIVNLDGRDMAQTPAYAGHIAYEHTFTLFGNDLDVTIQEEFSAEYETTHEFFFAGHTQPNYSKTNLMLAYNADPVTVNAFWRNIENETTIQSVFPFGVQGGEPELFGLSVTVDF